jgi:hypothetical protein
MIFRARCFAVALTALLVVLAPLFTPRVARAQDDAAIQMARERFQEGVKFYDAKQYDKARAAFLQAYALKKHPAVLLNLAQSELRSGHEADAAKHFAQYIRENKDASAAERQEAEKGLSESKKSVGEITVSVGAENADLYVDGNLEGRSPLAGPLYLKPGSHNLEARKDGKTATATVTALAGQSGSVELSFGGPGSGVAPVPGPGPSVGPGAEPSTGPVTGPAGGPATGPGAGQQGPEPDRGGEKPSFLDWAKDNTLAWVGGGIAVLGLAGGVGFAIAAKKSYDDADSIKGKILSKANEIGVSRPCGPPPVNQNGVDFAQACSTYQQRVDDGDGQKSWATVSFVVAGVAVAGTVVYYFLDTGSNKASVGRATRRPERTGFRASVVPMVGPNERGFGLMGQF